MVDSLRQRRQQILNILEQIDPLILAYQSKINEQIDKRQELANELCKICMQRYQQQITDLFKQMSNYAAPPSFQTSAQMILDIVQQHNGEDMLTNFCKNARIESEYFGGNYFGKTAYFLICDICGLNEPIACKTLSH